MMEMDFQISANLFNVWAEQGLSIALGEVFAAAIRGHWSIENKLHWVKDVTLNEDNCIHSGNYSPANWAIVRQLLVSLSRQCDCRTLPDANRLMANQLQLMFDPLFDCPKLGVDRSDSIASNLCSDN